MLHYTTLNYTILHYAIHLHLQPTWDASLTLVQRFVHSLSLSVHRAISIWQKEFNDRATAVEQLLITNELLWVELS